MSFSVALAIDNLAWIKKVGHLCFHLRSECYGAVVFVVVRLVLKNTVLLALSRWFLVLLWPLSGRAGGTQPQLTPL